MNEINEKSEDRTQGKYLAFIAASLMAESAAAERRFTFFCCINILSVLLILVSIAVEHKLFLYFSISMTLILLFYTFYEFLGTQRKLKEFDKIGDAARIELQFLFHRNYGTKAGNNLEISPGEMKVLLKLREASSFKESTSLLNLFKKHRS